MKLFKKRIGKHSVTHHWVKNNIGVMAAILMIIGVIFLLIIRHYYIKSVKETMDSELELVTNSFNQRNEMLYNGNSYLEYVYRTVENFKDKEKYELLAVNSDGSVEISSSGFSYENKMEMPDYEEAKNNNAKKAVKIYKTEFGEEVIAETELISINGDKCNALRLISSMKGVRHHILVWSIVVIIIIIGIIMTIFFSGMFFIRSIVFPVIRIGEVARKFAKGDFSERIENNREDEIGKLCNSINYMADELSNTEAMKNEFISSISHELRTPLTAIKGWSETLIAIRDDEETFKKGMRVITSETERLSQMVEELLDFSRIQDNRLTLNMAKMDILAELGETILIYQERAKELGIKLDYYEPEMLPFVYGDKNRLKQVFINIVDNAIKYSDKGDTVSVEAYEHDNNICISVSDTGMGIAKEDLPKIKTKFFKANHTRRGSGIGLAVADEIIQRHDGTLTIKSEEGVGTTVMITIPCMEKQKKLQNDEIIKVELVTTDENYNN